MFFRDFVIFVESLKLYLPDNTNAGFGMRVMVEKKWKVSIHLPSATINYRL